MFLLWLLFYSAQPSRSTSGTSITPLAALHQTDHFLLGVPFAFLPWCFILRLFLPPGLHFNPRFPQSLGANREQRSLFFLCVCLSRPPHALARWLIIQVAMELQRESPPPPALANGMESSLTKTAVKQLLRPPWSGYIRPPYSGYNVPWLTEV
jgi:hypothetical protein